jgi:hypothetical protein
MTIRDDPAARGPIRPVAARSARNGTEAWPPDSAAVRPDAAVRPSPVRPVPARPAPVRPDPRPMRFALAAGSLAALSALVATVAASAVPSPVPAATPVLVQQDSPAEVALVQHVTRVVKLPPGVAAPATGRNVLVTQLPAPVVKPRTVVVTTTQSGRVVKP